MEGAIEQILKNQKEILANQKTILANIATIKKNQQEIEAGIAKILDEKKQTP